MIKEYKLWVDDVRPAPKGYWHCVSVNIVKEFIQVIEDQNKVVLEYNQLIEDCNKTRLAFNQVTDDNNETILRHKPLNKILVIDIDHDAGDYAKDGGDYIKLLDWLEETGRNYPIRIHSQNPVGVQNMRRIIQKNGWIEIKELI